MLYYSNNYNKWISRLKKRREKLESVNRPFDDEYLDITEILDSYYENQQKGELNNEKSKETT